MRLPNLIKTSLKVAKGLGITETWLLGLQWRNGGRKVDEPDDDDQDEEKDEKKNGKMQMRIWIAILMMMIHFSKAG